jgi:inhibitor of cysteine peptidase
MPALIQGTPDNGSTVTVKRGQAILIKLPENPSTGFRWSVEQSARPFLELKQTDFAATGTIAGGGGERRFEFIAATAGEGRLSLRRWREWEGETSIVERYEISVRVMD